MKKYFKNTFFKIKIKNRIQHKLKFTVLCLYNKYFYFFYYYRKNTVILLMVSQINLNYRNKVWRNILHPHRKLANMSRMSSNVTG